MDFWIAVVSGGAAILGAGVGGIVAALPALGAERRALRAEHRRELRAALLRTLDLIRLVQNDIAREDNDAMVVHSREFIRELSVLGTLLGKRDNPVIEYLGQVMALTIGEHPEGPDALRQAAVALPDWYRGGAKLRHIRAAIRQWPDADELFRRDRADA